MSNDPAGRIVAYQKAWQAFQRALQAAEQCVQRAREQAARLEQWKQLPPPGRAPAGTVGLRLVVDEMHSSPVGARVCLACGAVLLTASEPGALRVKHPPDRHVQESDF